MVTFGDRNDFHCSSCEVLMYGGNYFCKGCLLHWLQKLANELSKLGNVKIW